MSAIEINALLGQHNAIRQRVLKLLAEIEQSPNAQDALLWMMPFGEGRAHITWQMMHCGATLDKYLNVRILNREAVEPKLVELYGGGSAADRTLAVSPQEIRDYLERTTKPYWDHYRSLDDTALPNLPHPGADRSYRDMLFLLNWHEASHQGQCQIIWNSYRASH